MQQAQAKLSIAQTELLALIKSDKANEALALNAKIAVETPSDKEMEDWFVEKIERAWPTVAGQPRLAWMKAQNPAPTHRRYVPQYSNYAQAKDELIAKYKPIAAE